MPTFYGKKKQQQAEAAWAKQIASGQEFDWAKIRAIAVQTIHGKKGEGDTTGEAIKNARAAMRALKASGKTVDKDGKLKDFTGTLEEIDFTKGMGRITGESPATTVAGRGGVAGTSAASPAGVGSPNVSPSTATPSQGPNTPRQTSKGRRPRSTRSDAELLPGRGGSRKFAEAALTKSNDVAKSLAAYEKSVQAARAIALRAVKEGKTPNPSGKTDPLNTVGRWLTTPMTNMGPTAAEVKASQAAEQQRVKAAKSLAQHNKKLEGLGWVAPKQKPRQRKTQSGTKNGVKQYKPGR